MSKRVPPEGYAGPESTRAAFTDQDSHPIVLDLILLREFGTEYLAWEADTLWTEIRKTWGTTTSTMNQNRIQAIRTCHVQASPYREWEVFENVAAALNGVPPRFDLLQRPSAPHAAAALEIIQQLRDDVPVRDEVYRYCSAIMMDQGVAWGPGTLLPCNKYVGRMVGKPLQERVARSVSSGRIPTFDGTANEDDTQTMKSLAIKDYCALLSQQLLQQVNHLLPKQGH
jgi:hypothetical protein